MRPVLKFNSWPPFSSFFPLVENSSRFSRHSATAASLTTVAALALGSCVYCTRLDDEAQSTKQQGSAEDDDMIPSSKKIPVDMVHRLAFKPYLRIVPDRQPPAIPDTLRLLTVDLPSVRQHGISGSCHRQDVTFPDGVAVPLKRELLVSDDDEYDDTKKVKSHHRKKQYKNDGTALLSFDVEQKVLVKELYQCYNNSNNNAAVQPPSKCGVEIMEANIESLNPLNLRRTPTFGYSPAEYIATSRRRTTTQVENKSSSSNSTEKKTPIKNLDDAPSMNESSVPWYQYAWLEEIQLRISGQVVFGQPLQRAGQLRRLVFGDTYCRTVFRSGSWLLPWTEPAGLDGDGTQNWASNKPHAVIANGAALHRVPKALHALRRACKDHDVPLYIIDDPRRWGGNTHDSLEAVLTDLRQTIKRRMVTASIRHTAGRSFQTGRLVGHVETEAKWQAHLAARKASELWNEAQRIKKDRKDRDWSKLDSEALKEKLLCHGLIRRDHTSVSDYICTEELLDVARLYAPTHVNIAVEGQSVVSPDPHGVPEPQAVTAECV